MQGDQGLMKTMGTPPTIKIHILKLSFEHISVTTNDSILC